MAAQTDGTLGGVAENGASVTIRNSCLVKFQAEALSV
jgi:hypothetical protein